MVVTFFAWLKKSLNLKKTNKMESEAVSIYEQK